MKSTGAIKSWIKYGAALISIFTIGGTTTVSYAYNDLDTLTELNQRGQSQEAYALAKDVLRDHEGEPKFDLQYSIAALDAGYPDQALLPLERVILTNPRNLRARLELARAQTLTQNFKEAKLNFKRVLEADPPKAVRENIDQYLNAIRKAENPVKFSVSFNTEIQQGYDTNINSAPDSATFYSPIFGPGTIDQDSLQRESEFTKLRTHATATRTNVESKSVLSALASISATHYNRDSDFDSESITLAGSAYKQFGKWVIGSTVYADATTVDQKLYRKIAGITAKLAYHHDSKSSTSLEVSRYNTKYIDHGSRNASTNTISLTRKDNVLDSLNLTLGAFLGSDTPHDRSFSSIALLEKTTQGLRLDVEWIASENTKIALNLAAQRDKYAERNPFFGDNRVDITRKAALKALWYPTVNLETYILIESLLNKSNFDIYDYKRYVTSMGVGYKY